jgi:hypothetical protein
MVLGWADDRSCCLCIDAGYCFSPLLLFACLATLVCCAKHGENKEKGDRRGKFRQRCLIELVTADFQPRRTCRRQTGAHRPLFPPFHLHNLINKIIALIATNAGK